MLIPHNQLTASWLDADAVSSVIMTGYWSAGPKVEAMEALLNAKFFTGGAVAVSSGLSGLRLALLALGVAKGDEVILPAYSCVALANAILSLGAVPVPVDIESRTYNIDPIEVTKALTENTKAVIVVNTFGAPAVIEKIKPLGIKILEDCSHGFLLMGDGQQQIGTIRGDAAVFSFYATKLIPGGEGGAVLSNDESIVEFVRDYRDYTDKNPNGLRLNDKMTDITAALVSRQLEVLGEKIAQREKIARIYENLFKELSSKIDLPNMNEKRVWYRYAVNLKRKLASTLIEDLRKRGVCAAKPVVMWSKSDNSRVKNSVQADLHTVSLPLYPSLKKEEISLVVESFIGALA